MASERDNLRRDEMREWLQVWVDSTSQRRVAEALGVNRDPLRRALQGTGEVTGVVLEAVERYARAHGIQILEEEPETSSSIGREGADDGTGGSEVDGDEDGQHGEDGDTGTVPRECDANGRDRTELAAEASQGRSDEGQRDAERRDVAKGGGTDDRESLSLPGKIDDAETPAELAELVGAPVLAELQLEAARAGARALARGWRWVRDPAPAGLHGDALYYLHTREEVSFADDGAKRVAFAPDTQMFECGLTGAELRYGVHPYQRQKRYAVDRLEDRGLLIGLRMSALVPEKPYPDEKWFFGSVGSVIDGEWQGSAAEIITARRKLLVLSDSFSEDGTGKPPTPWQLALRNEQMRLELLMVNSRYALTIGEHVNGDRTWAPSTRLGIETCWREADIQLNEAAIHRELRRRRRLKMLLWLQRLILRRLCSPRKGEVNGDVSGAKDWGVTAPPWSDEYLTMWRQREFDEDNAGRSDKVTAS